MLGLLCPKCAKSHARMCVLYFVNFLGYTPDRHLGGEKKERDEIGKDWNGEGEGRGGSGEEGEIGDLKTGRERRE